jgi:hypothetical protein
MFSKTDINYVEDIVSLNIQKIKESSNMDSSQENVNSFVDKSYHAEQIK